MRWSGFYSKTFCWMKNIKKGYKHGEIVADCSSFPDFVSRFELVGLKCIRDNRVDVTMADAAADIFMPRAMLIDGCDNYYIETRALLRFLRDTEVRDISPLLDLVSNKGSPCPMNKRAYNCIIRFPLYGEDDASVFVHIDIHNISIEYGYDETASVEYSFINSEWETNDDGTALAQKNINLVANLFLYAACFPECITNKAPNEISFDKKLQGKHRIVRAAESIVDRSGPSPHFRRGYFKRLTSEHWTHKRGQVVFVRSTFVKGQAKTVLDSSEAREEMEARP